jgi:hypothetical protein
MTMTERQKYSSFLVELREALQKTLTGDLFNTQSDIFSVDQTQAQLRLFVFPLLRTLKLIRITPFVKNTNYFPFFF